MINKKGFIDIEIIFIILMFLIPWILIWYSMEYVEDMTPKCKKLYYCYITNKCLMSKEEIYDYKTNCY
jgi:hypothetical protein